MLLELVRGSDDLFRKFLIHIFEEKDLEEIKQQADDSFQNNPTKRHYTQ